MAGLTDDPWIHPSPLHQKIFRDREIEDEGGRSNEVCRVGPGQQWRFA
jgi:hypothetical protein